jgi:hypothetical protein
MAQRPPADTAPQAGRLAVLGLADVARLARVDRSVVSKWRTRFVGTGRAFPDPVATTAGRSTFDAAAVARWLIETSHGNNPAAAEDVAAFATLPDASPRHDRAVFEALTALLCLKVMTSARLSELDRAGLLDLADEHDPDDLLLYRELVDAGDRIGTLASQADALADAAFHPAAAFESLLDDRLRSARTEDVSATISPVVHRLVAQIAVDLSGRTSTPVTYSDPTPGSSDLLLSVIAEHGDRGPADVVTANSDEPQARLERRRLRTHDVFRQDAPEGAGTGAESGRLITHVAQFPNPASPSMSDLQILDAVDDLVLSMSGLERGLVLAPASALSDGSDDNEANQSRARIIRAGHVHAVVKLPKGLVPARPRQPLAFWVLGPADYATRPEDRFTTVANLANETLTTVVADSLSTDLAAVTGSRRFAATHTARFARFVPTRLLLAANSNLVDQGQHAGRTRTSNPSAQVIEIGELQQAIAAPTPPPVPIEARPTDTEWLTTADVALLGSLVDDKSLRVLRGRRIDPADISVKGGARLIGVEELVLGAPVGARTIDRLTLAGLSVHAQLTEPGDVVFCSSPRPAAMVDRLGGSVVTFPARTLRVNGSKSGLVPDVLASDIAALGPRAREWRSWVVRRVSGGQCGPLADSLTALAAVRHDLQSRISAVERLTQLLVDGTTGGSLVLESTPTETEGN